MFDYVWLNSHKIRENHLLARKQRKLSRTIRQNGISRDERNRSFLLFLGFALQTGDIDVVVILSSSAGEASGALQGFLYLIAI